MNFNEYQGLAWRSRNHSLDEDPEKTLTVNALGCAGEAGEVADLIKKHVGYGTPLDVAKLKEELGDQLWYIAALASDAGLTLEQIAEANVEKLKRRFPEGFTKEAAVARADEEDRVSSR